MQTLPRSSREVKVRLVLGVSVRHEVHLPARAAAGLRAEARQEEGRGEARGDLARRPHRARARRAGRQPDQDHARDLPRVEEEED